MKNDLFEDIIRKNFEGTATAQEKGMLLNWLKQDPERQELFFSHLLKRETERPQRLPNLDKKLAEYEMFLRGEKPINEMLHVPPSVDLRQKRKRTLHVGWAAALILLLCIAGYAARDVMLYRTYYSQAEGVRAISLDDGSTVILNVNSSLKVPRGFPAGGTREVWIEGEAFFQVSKKEDLQKFVVHARDLEVQVLGTKFNVNSRGRETEVTLDEGKVKLVSSAKKVLVMKPGEQVSVSGNGLDFRKRIVDVDAYTGWKSSVLSFDNTPLSQVVSTIEQYYGVTIALDSLLGTRQFTGTLPNNDLDLVLRAIATTYDRQVERNENEIRFKK